MDAAVQVALERQSRRGQPHAARVLRRRRRRRDAQRDRRQRDPGPARSGLRPARRRHLSVSRAGELRRPQSRLRRARRASISSTPRAAGPSTTSSRIRATDCTTCSPTMRSSRGTRSATRSVGANIMNSRRIRIERQHGSPQSRRARRRPDAQGLRRLDDHGQRVRRQRARAAARRIVRPTGSATTRSARTTPRSRCSRAPSGMRSAATSSSTTGAMLVLSGRDSGTRWTHRRPRQLLEPLPRLRLRRRRHRRRAASAGRRVRADRRRQSRGPHLSAESGGGRSGTRRAH